ncbi:STM4013/SEN3800 family hydrolase [Tahibacter amnicola]|uniref:STM4013/SEN3800 family hydrolase n=1 Tax=Tahibacter amnicola TaxID=2976241 RepID=A0ABY6BIZ0_9GAMM|nr:STM4013/SEN3800 family hydrolase [Tahibacter amnicola]UXI69457.1 STM4013/SEN3800 family hydrolase [Tahibacter amnicola]
MVDPIPDMNQIVGSHDIVLLTLDTLRYDVAQQEFLAGRLPHLGAFLPADGWEKRHTPGSFTYAAHRAFFAGFLPTPAEPGLHPRLFALYFPGSETTHEHTAVFHSGDNIAAALAHLGYHTVCIGGVGFFNPYTPLGRDLPGLFDEAHWRPAFSVVAPDSTAAQVTLACRRLSDPDFARRKLFLFMNISALHQPNHHYLAGCEVDDIHSHAAALRYVDEALAPLWRTLRRRGPAFVIVCSDHGTAYGEDGYTGHRHAHEVVMTVPYAHFQLPRMTGSPND